MKALSKKTMGFFLLAGLMICNISLIHAQEDSDFITISGVVKDSKTKRKLEYVNVTVSGSNLGTVTNDDGEFSIKVKDSINAKQVYISHVGYKNASIAINGSDMNGQEILLTPLNTLLEEVVIRARDPRFLVEEAIKKIETNYSPTTNMHKGFYRETAQKGRRYINISEAVIDIYKTPYNENVEKDRVQIYKGRSLLSQKKSDTLVVKLLGGPNLSIYVDIVKNPDLLLDLETLPFYSFRMEESVMIDDRPQYVISFQPQAILPYALYYGKLYIDKDNMAFTRAEFNLNMDDSNKATQAILRKKPFGLRFKPQEVSYLVTYNQRGEKTYLSYIRNEVRFKCDWKRRLFSTTYNIQSEMVITDTSPEPETSIPYRMAFKPTQSLSDKVADFFDEDFWGGYNIIEPTESLESAVNKLKKQRR